jgi:hypothetical protein
MSNKLALELGIGQKGDRLGMKISRKDIAPS